MASTFWREEVGFLAKVVEWTESAPENDLFYIDSVTIHNENSEVVGRYYLGEDGRFERAVTD